jgi:hypothetical protein
MSYFDNYLQRINYDGTTPAESLKSYYQRLLNDGFMLSPTVKTVKHNGVMKTVRVTSYKLRNSLLFVKDDYKEIQFSNLDDVAYLGDIFEFDGLQWICIDTRTSSLLNMCVVRRCNNYLKLANYSPIPCFISNIVVHLEQDKVIEMPNNQLNCGVQYNDTTKMISLSPPTRFILNGSAWKVMGLDNGLVKAVNGQGVLQITLESDQINPKDDLVNGIAYNEPLQQSIITNSYIIDGSDNIPINQTQTYNILNQNTIPVNSTFMWSLSNSNAVIISSTNTSCIIKGVTEGQVILTASDGTNQLTKTITIQSSLW